MNGLKKNNIRTKTCIIIRKHGQYLRGRDMLTGRIVWTWSAYEAWRTRDEDKARDVARETGGIMVLFNPIVNQKKVM